MHRLRAYYESTTRDVSTDSAWSEGLTRDGAPHDLMPGGRIIAVHYPPKQTHDSPGEYLARAMFNFRHACEGRSADTADQSPFDTIYEALNITGQEHGIGQPRGFNLAALRELASKGRGSLCQETLYPHHPIA